MWTTQGTTYIAGTPNILRAISLVSMSNVKLADGTESVPSLTFSSDTNTGLFSGGGDVIGFTTGGSEKMRIASDGKVGIGIVPTVKFEVNGGNILLSESGDTSRAITITRNGINSARLSTSNAGCSLENTLGTDFFFTNSSGTWANYRGTGLFIGDGTGSATARLHVGDLAASADTVDERIRIEQSGSTLSSKVDLIAGVVSGGSAYFSIETRRSDFTQKGSTENKC